MFDLIVAPGGTGKTFFDLDLVVSVALGRSIAGGLLPAAAPAKAVYLPSIGCFKPSQKVQQDPRNPLRIKD